MHCPFCSGGVIAPDLTIECFRVLAWNRHGCVARFAGLCAARTFP